MVPPIEIIFVYVGEFSMDQTWLKGNNFRPISGTIYLRNVKLTKAPHLDVHVNLTFENYNFNAVTCTEPFGSLRMPIGFGNRPTLRQ
ncbi:hypothetical protein OKW33_006104 [Paraburkholderia atlantica]|uniref:Uncharacterized protein n=1 Tax=Paraburkholderia atlantica TaxID=2654982 RepID=A0A7W8QGI9_PARAM|nr:hypothetical protein [Paraburkholderia atlantica]